MAHSTWRAVGQAFLICLAIGGCGATAQDNRPDKISRTATHESAQCASARSRITSMALPSCTLQRAHSTSRRKSRGSADFTTNIAESNFRYTQAVGLPLRIRYHEEF
jgi:hypothetical protein